MEEYSAHVTVLSFIDSKGLDPFSYPWKKNSIQNLALFFFSHEKEPRLFMQKPTGMDQITHHS